MPNRILLKHLRWSLATSVRYGARVGEVQKKNETGTLQEQITFNEARRGSGQISQQLENPRDVGGWWAAMYGVAQSEQSRIRLKRLSSSSSSCSYLRKE